MGTGAILIIFAWPITVIIGFLIGSFSAVLIATVISPLNATIGWPLGSLAFSFIVGGLAGFFPFIFPLVSGNFSDMDLIVFITWGPFPAMFLSHVSAYWLTRKTIDAHNDRPAVIPHQPKTKFFWSTHFSIKQMMIFTVWIAAGFAIFSLLSPESRYTLVKCFLGAQIPAAALAACFLWLFYRFKHRKKRRKKRIRKPIAASQA